MDQPKMTISELMKTQLARRMIENMNLQAGPRFVLTPEKSTMIGTKEIAAMLGLTRRYVTNVVVKRPDFPKPAVTLSSKTKRWEEVDVMRWMRSNTGSNFSG